LLISCYIRSQNILFKSATFALFIHLNRIIVVLTSFPSEN